jgi:hypothetical protein
MFTRLRGLRVNRRLFLFGGVITAAGGSLAVLCFLRLSWTATLVDRACGLLSRRCTSRLAAKFRRALPDLQVSEAVVLQFSEDYEKAFGKPIRCPVPEDILKRFLLSTDFVQSGCALGRRVEYVAFYSPFHTPCYNPFMLLRSKNSR